MSLHRDDVSQLRKVIKAAIARGELLERAVEGLTDEQIEAIPRLVAWFTDPRADPDIDGFEVLHAIFPMRES